MTREPAPRTAAEEQLSEYQHKHGCEPTLTPWSESSDLHKDGHYESNERVYWEPLRAAGIEAEAASAGGLREALDVRQLQAAGDETEGPVFPLDDFLRRVAIHYAARLQIEAALTASPSAPVQPSLDLGPLTTEQPANQSAAPLDVERLARAIVAQPASWDMGLTTEEAVKRYAADILATLEAEAES